jgi:hypothetical protein
LPHPPQLLLSVCKFLHAFPEHKLSPVEQVSAQLPALHATVPLVGAVHATQAVPPNPHAAVVSAVLHVPPVVQHPLAHVVALQGVTHFPAVHVAPLAQTFPHPPQLLLSVCRFLHALPEHKLSPVGQVSAQLPALHATVPLVGAVHATHALPPTPHAATVSVVVHAPLVVQQPVAHVAALQAAVPVADTSVGRAASVNAKVVDPPFAAIAAVPGVTVSVVPD